MNIVDILNNAQWLNKKSSQNLIIERLIVMMGSNDNAANNIIAAKSLLQNLAYVNQLTTLTYHISQDHTQRATNVYHNQAVILSIKKNTLAAVIHDLKIIEKKCGRDDQKNSAKFGYLVALDLDVLFVYADGWYRIIEQFPLKLHELICLGVLSE